MNIPNAGIQYICSDVLHGLPDTRALKMSINVSIYT